jgi:hypothetical protein
MVIDKNALALDRALVSEAVYRYHRAFDLKDWETCRGLFADTVEVETAGMEGSVPDVQTFARDRWIKILSRMGSPDTASQHFSTNHVVEINGDEAVCIANSLARSARTQDGKQVVSVVGGYYTFSLVRTDHGWRVRKFRFDQLWSENRDPDAGKIQDR